jgi:hypothetical protein
MPISLRLPSEVESQIAGFGARTGLSKSAVIVRSIQEFLARHAEPSSQQIYQQVMQEAQGKSGAAKADLLRESLEHRTLKQQVRKAIRSKHALRSARAAKVP